MSSSLDSGLSSTGTFAGLRLLSSGTRGALFAFDTAHLHLMPCRICLKNAYMSLSPLFSTGGTPIVIIGRADAGRQQEAVADAVIKTLSPIRDRYLELSDDSEQVRDILGTGAGRARKRASGKVRQAKEAIGILAP